MKSHSDVIAAFGGTKPLAEAINVDPRLTIHWHRRGIPAKYWPKVEAAAVIREPRVPVTAAMLMALPACLPVPAGVAA